MQHFIDTNCSPKAANRGIMIDLARVPERPDYVISLLPFLSRCKFNQLYFNLENKLEYKNYPTLAHKCAWSQNDMQRVIAEAEKYSIEIIPIPSTIGHMESIFKHKEFAHLAEPDTADHLAIYKKEAREFIGNIIDELCYLCPGGYIHLAGDETPYLGRSLCKDSTEAADTLVRCYADGINFMADRVRRRGKRAIIWADMVLHYPKLMELLDKDIILIDWHYGALDLDELKSPAKLLDGGFTVGVAGGILADEPFLPTLDRIERNLPYISKRNGIWGVINCMWEPRTQTLPVAKIGMAVAGACSWNPFHIDRENILSNASKQVYGIDLSEMYRLLATSEFFERMVQTKMGYYHSFEFSRSHPAVHLADKIDSWWQNVYERMEKGLECLAEKQEFRKEFPEDYQAFMACGMLGKCLAGFVLHMQGIDSNSPTKLRQFAAFIKETLECQRIAWSISRFENDDNFDWWFADPLQYKIECIEALADDIEQNKESDYEILQFDVKKGDSSTWNLLRMKILFSDDQKNYKQMFFRTIPLWMDDSVSFMLMPKGSLPQFVKIEFSCWTWHNNQTPWTQIVNWKTMKKTLRCPRAVSVTNKFYETENISDESILLRLVENRNNHNE